MYELRVALGSAIISVETDHEYIYNALLSNLGDTNNADVKNAAVTAKYLVVSPATELPDSVRGVLNSMNSSLKAGVSSHIQYLTEAGYLYYQDKYATWLFMPAEHIYACIIDMSSWLLTGYSESDFYYLIFRTMFYEGLWQCRLYWLHAAAVRHSQLGSLLFVGDRNHSKSTLAVAFLEAGHEMLTDDSVFFETPSGNNIDFHTVPREIHIDPKLGHKIDALQGIEHRSPYGEEEFKVAIGLYEFFPTGIISRLSGANVIFFPHIVDKPRTTITQIGQTEAFWRLLCHAYTGLRDDQDGSITKGFVMAIHHILSEADVYVLNCGRDCYDDPRLYVSVIEGLLGAPEVSGTVAEE